MRRSALLLLCPLLVLGRPLAAADSAAVLATATEHLRLALAAQPESSFSLGRLDASRLPDCRQYEAFLPPGTRLLGRTTVGVRCLAPARWSVLVPAQIAVTGNYVTTGRAIAAGQTIGAGDLLSVSGDIAQLPTGTLRDPAQAVGKTLRQSLAAGQPLRAEQLQAPLTVRQGENVRVISRGEGFAASAEGQALNNAAAGQPARVRLGGGQIVGGTAQEDGSVVVGTF